MAYIDDVYLVVNIAPVGIPTYVRLSQNENGRRLYFAVTGGEIPSGSTATMSGTKPDGVVYSKAGTVSGNTVTFNEDIQLTAVAGEWPAKIVIVNGGQTVMTARIRFVIDADTVAAGAVPSDSQLEGLVAQAASYAEAAKDGAFYGSPLVASTVAGMTDKTRIYVYTGSESGYTSGNWYYWDGSTWTSGGVYNATAVSTDTTLSVAGKAADAKATGDAIRAVTIPTDKTLTQSDKPADAKVVGDELSDLKDDLTDAKANLEQLMSIETTIQFSDIGSNCIALNMAVGQTVSLTPYQSSNNTWRYAIVPCNAGQKIELNIVGGSIPRAYGFIDENNILLAVADYGAFKDTVIAPENTSKLVLNDNSNGTAYFITSEGRVDALEKEVAELKTESIEIIVGNNIYDSSKNTYGKMFYESNNNVVWYENQHTSVYTSFIVPVESGYITFSSDEDYTTLSRYYFTTSDTLPAPFISSATTSQNIGNGYTVQVPDGATFMCCSFHNLSENTHMMVNKGQTALPYEPYSIGYYVNNEKIQMESSIDAEYVKAPSEYNLVVGDTFQLFYKGIINAVHPEIYDVVVSCAKGKAFERFYEITPSVAETLTMTISLYGLSHELLESKIITLNIHEKASSPSAVKNILCVGNSLTVDGEWVKEVHRRLTQTDGTPEGDGLNNINFIGTKVSNGVHYEGYGGWTFRSYNTENVSENSKDITCSHDKTQDDQHSIYKASNNSTWKLETIENGQIKILNVSGSPSTFPSTGTLTWVSGGTNHNDIVYTASANSAGNPFWNSATNRVDFANYASSLGVSSIDYVYVLLGWNSAGTKEADYKAMAQTFIDNVHASFPNAEIVLIGLEIPARDGLANNYGAKGIYSQYFALMQYVFSLDKCYADLASDNTNVSSINLSGQFDTEYNMRTATRQVNTRNSATETYQSNGVHPANSGYMQIADAVYRDITAKL